MRKEKHFPLTDQQIHNAEVKRTQGYLFQAINLTQPAVIFPLTHFPELSQPDQTRLLMATRINVVARTTDAKRAWGAPMAAHRLEETREIITRVYRDEHVQEAVPTIREDTQGSPYEFLTEMARDEVRYTVVLAALTGNTDLLRGAIKKLNTIIETSQEPTAATLAVFERDRLVFQANDRTAGDFGQLKASYRAATTASQVAGNWERVATIASWYALDAQSQGDELESHHAYTLYQEAAANNPATAKIFARERDKADSERLKRRQWRETTPEGMNYSYLRLEE